MIRFGSITRYMLRKSLTKLHLHHISSLTGIITITSPSCRITNVWYSTEIRIANYSTTTNPGDSADKPITFKNKTISNIKQIKSIPDSKIKKSVFISQSYDIFTNLALEDWIYKNYDFTNHHILMLWLNDPCVVIGKHQNPFLETNVSVLQQMGILLARRNSGGGAVYHDRGNLNCTFFTPRERYNRSYNLNILTRALYREWSIKASISRRDDIMLCDKKISGTAAKLGHPNAYHHCTLLVNSNKLHLNESLIKDEVEIVSNSTPSVRTPIKNLVDVNRHVSIPQLLSAIGNNKPLILYIRHEFLRTSATELVECDRDMIMKQCGFQLINPTDKWFPGLMELRDLYSSWNWRIGKTPKFTVQKSIQLNSDENQHTFKLIIEVSEGIMENIFLVVSNSVNLIPIVSSLKGNEYNEDNLNIIIAALKGLRVKEIINN